MSTHIEEAMRALKDAMKEDPSYAWSWHCVVACSSQDEGMEHAASNRAAARFMRQAFEVDTSHCAVQQNAA